MCTRSLMYKFWELRGEASVVLLCGANDNDSVLLPSTCFVAGRVFDAVYTSFYLVLIAALQGGETEAQRG